MLGDSRAAGTHSPSSDYDIGLYYSKKFSPQEIEGAVSKLLGYPTHFTQLYEWGPRVNGGAWLHYDDIDIDILYRFCADVATSTCRLPVTFTRFLNLSYLDLWRKNHFLQKIFFFDLAI